MEFWDDKMGMLLFVDPLGLESIAVEVCGATKLAYTATLEQRIKFLGGIGVDFARAAVWNDSGYEIEMSKSRLIAHEPCPRDHFRVIQETFHQRGCLFSDLSLAAAALKIDNDPKWLTIAAKFDAPQFWGANGDVEAINRSRNIYFVLGFDSLWFDDYILEDDYFKRPKMCPVMMPASLSHIPEAQHGVGWSSHIGRRLRYSGGRKIFLRAFGALSSCDAQYLVLKPYVIFRDSRW